MTYDHFLLAFSFSSPVLWSLSLYSLLGPSDNNATSFVHRPLFLFTCLLFSLFFVLFKVDSVNGANEEVLEETIRSLA